MTTIFLALVRLFRFVVSKLTKRKTQKPAPEKQPWAKMTYLSPHDKKQVTLYQSQMTPHDWQKAKQMIAGLDTAVWMESE